MPRDRGAELHHGQSILRVGKAFWLLLDRLSTRGVPEARHGIGDYFEFFNDERPHQALGYSVPAAVYFLSLAESARKVA